jgi:hypothetical protein
VEYSFADFLDRRQRGGDTALRRVLPLDYLGVGLRAETPNPAMPGDRNSHDSVSRVPQLSGSNV